MIKIGDKVRVVRNRSHGNHPVENRLLVAGDIVKVGEIGDEKMYYSCINSPSGINYILIADVVKEEFTFIISRNKL